MTTISNLGAANTPAAASAAVSGAWGHHGRHGHNPVQAVSSLLGMSTDDITSELKSGKSLDDIASEHGVSHGDLVNAIVAGMPERMRNSDRATDIAEKIAIRKGLPTPPPLPQAPPADGSGQDAGVSGVIGSSLSPAQQKMLDDISSLLGEDTDTLLQDMRSGTSLATIAAAKGVSGDSLTGVLQDGILFDTSV